MARPTGSPRPRAAALRYRPEDPFKDAAPRLVAKGQGLLAERILALAKEHGISVSRDPDLLAALEPLDLDRLIPPELFQAVAILLAALYRANKKASGVGS
ncbi:MAG: EscU/YscU/HrcU family type III secretion system export apparatus switch protein [Geothrix sp.]|nr:EscU/YscU/HrcU family type III secretion system export apparatus switch protein [Geothrix sp.]